MQAFCHGFTCLCYNRKSGLGLHPKYSIIQHNDSTSTSELSHVKSSCIPYGHSPTDASASDVAINTGASSLLTKTSIPLMAMWGMHTVGSKPSLNEKRPCKRNATTDVTVVRRFVCVRAGCACVLQLSAAQAAAQDSLIANLDCSERFTTGFLSTEYQQPCLYETPSYVHLQELRGLSLQSAAKQRAERAYHSLLESCRKFELPGQS